MEDAAINRAIPAAAAESLREDGGLAIASYPVFDIAAFRAGDLSPVIFGSALKGFGVRQLLDVLADGGPAPGAIGQACSDSAGRAAADRLRV